MAVACAMCIEDFDPNYLAGSKYAAECNHGMSTCKDCLERWIETGLSNASKWDKITCPECPRFLDHADLQGLISDRVFSAFDSRSVKAAVEAPSGPGEEFHYCKTPGCGSGQFVGGLDEMCTSFMCGNCGGQTQVTNHESEADQEATLRLINKTTRACPNCKTRIERNGGCNLITCRHCRHEWCWECARAFTDILRIGHPPECPLSGLLQQGQYLMGVPDDAVPPPRAMLQLRPEAVNPWYIKEAWDDWTDGELKARRLALQFAARRVMHWELFTPSPISADLRVRLGRHLLAIETYYRNRTGVALPDNDLGIGPDNVGELNLADFDEEEEQEEDDAMEVDSDEGSNTETNSDDDPEFADEKLPFVVMAEDDEDMDYIRGEAINPRLDAETAGLRRLISILWQRITAGTLEQANGVMMDIIDMEMDVRALLRIKAFFARTPTAILKISTSPPFPGNRRNTFAAYADWSLRRERILWI